MGAPASKVEMDAATYLEWERNQDERHEFVDGEVFAMTGGTARHSALGSTITGLLFMALRGSSCRVFSSDLRVAAAKGRRYLYPDISVVCGKLELEDDAPDMVRNPRLVVEVLSPSTEAYDRGDKWAMYSEVPSLFEYVLVSQARPRLEVFRRERDHWVYDVASAGERLALLEGAATLEVDAVYAGVLELPLASA